MDNYNRDSRGSGRGFGGGRGGNMGPRPPMHKAVCNECGAGCEVPFRPTGDRPIFCSSCFAVKQQNEGVARPPSNFGGERRERFDRPSYEDRPMHDAVCVKCGKNCQVPFRPSSGKPVYCNDCFERKAPVSGGSNQDSGEMMEQIKMLNLKIDKLIKILAPEVSEVKVKKSEVKKAVEEIEVKEVVKEKKTKAAAKKVVAKKKK